MNNKIAGAGLLFERYVSNLFSELGYDVKNEVQLKSLKQDKPFRRADVIAKKAGIEYCIEVKFSTISERAIEKIYSYTDGTDMIPVIVTAYEVKEEEKDAYKKKYPELEIIDISNLLHVVENNDRLKYDLTSILPFSVEDISPKESFLNANLLEDSNCTESLINELKQCKPGKKESSKYEDICSNVLKMLFSNDLTLWKKQQKSNEDLYRFDLLCRIKDDNTKTFWSIVENYFKSKYIVFEFKNYSEAVSQIEISTTERYLYSKALRSVGIIITPNGYEKNAYRAAKGCLRENGKLILLLTNNDLFKMIGKKNDDENPSNHLLEKLDEMLLELEK